MHRDLVLAIDPSLFGGMAGSTDSEVLFYLALTFGLEDDPIGAVERAVAFVEATGERHGIEHPVQATLGFSDGERLWGVRYSSEHSSRSLFVSQDVSALRKLHPDNPRLQQLSDTDHAIVSEPLGDLPGVVARGSRIDRHQDRGGGTRGDALSPSDVVRAIAKHPRPFLKGYTRRR